MNGKSILARHRILALNVALVVCAVGMTAALRDWRGQENVPAALADKDEVCVCHAAGQEGTTHFVTVCASRRAIFGNAGHFFENGTPRAGHEQDYIGRCAEPSPSPEPSPEPSPSPGL